MSLKGIYIQHLTKYFDSVYWVYTVVERYFSIFHCQSFSLSASPLPLKTFPLSFLSSSSYPLSCPFCPFLSSCCFIWVPDLSSLISVHPLHFDVRPHTATLATTKTNPFVIPHPSLTLCLLFLFFFLWLLFFHLCVFMPHCWCYLSTLS